jgi:hypothetical protein
MPRVPDVEDGVCRGVVLETAAAYPPDEGENMLAPVRDGEPVKPISRGKVPSKRPTSKLRVLRIVDIEFLSDHQLLLNSDDLLSDEISSGGAARVDKPEWIAVDETFAIDDRPVSHTMDQPIKLRIRIKFDAPRGVEVRGDVLGHVPLASTSSGRIRHQTLFAARDQVFRGGKTTTVEVTADESLEKRVQRRLLTVTWRILGSDITSMGLPSPPLVLAPRRESTHEILVTMDEPSTMRQYPGISVGRMRHAVQTIGKVWESVSDPQPRDIVEHLMQDLSGRFDLHHRPTDPWSLVDSSVNADCITICEFVLSMLKMVGCKGEIVPVLAYEKLAGDLKLWGEPGFITEKADDGKSSSKPALFIDRTKKDPVEANSVAVAEEVKPGQLFGGLGKPVLCELDTGPRPAGAPEGPRVKSTVTLTTDGFDKNDFEACLRFSHGGEVIYFPGGIPPKIDGAFAYTPSEVLRRTFKQLRWRGKGTLDGEVIKSYS